jgi:hypothetical protein
VVKEEEVKQDENLEEGKECEQGVRRHNKMTHKKKKKEIEAHQTQNIILRCVIPVVC